MITTREDILKIREENAGTLPAYAWPGGYPIFYVDGEDNILCPDCANKEEEYSSPTVAFDVNYEDNTMMCDDCGKVIECAYPPDEE